MLAVVLFLAFAAVLGAGYAIHDPALDAAGPPSDFDLLWDLGVLLLMLGAAVPATLLVVRVVDRRRPGALSSVAGRIRWRWLGACALAAAGVYGLAAVIAIPIDPPDRVDWGLATGALALTLLVVPLQAAGEEYVFRGYLAQAAGVFVRSPWLPAVLISVLFALAHGSLDAQGVPTFLDRLAFGLVAAWLTIRTAGLEAALALHTAGNVLGMSGLAVYGELDDYLIEDDLAVAGWEAAVDVALMIAFAALVARLAARRGIARSA